MNYDNFKDIDEFCTEKGLKNKSNPNIAMIPLNPIGALDLGLYPCEYCGQGWGMISSEGQHTSCSDTCEYMKRYKDENK